MERSPYIKKFYPCANIEAQRGKVILLCLLAKISVLKETTLLNNYT